MRLTLRTLLAYLDDVLDPADAAQLAKKVEDSEFAKGLVQRIRSASSRVRLGAPSLDGKGVGLDPNTVAEYLDNVMPPDRIPDLERICLESDVHLAEVASCHQILAIVLGEAAEVEPALRDRIYGIGASGSDHSATVELSRSADVAGYAPPPPAISTSPFMSAVPPAPYEAPPVPAAGPLAGSPPASNGHTVGRASVKVPEYLRAGQRSNWKPLMITLVLAFLVSAVALRAMAPFDRDHPILRLMSAGGGNQVAQSQPRDSLIDAPGPEATGTEQEQAERPGGAEPGATVGDNAGESPSNGGPGEIDSVGTAGLKDTPDVPDEPAPVALPVEPTRAQEDTPPIEPVGPNDDFPKTAAGVGLEPGGTEQDSPLPGENDLSEDEVMPAPGPVTAVPVEVGYVKMTDLHFLLRLDPKTREWFRLPARSKLFSGDYLRVLPTYRPEIVLTPGVQAVFAGPSSVYLPPPTPQGEPTMLMEYGRAFIATAGVPGARLHLNLDGRSSVVTFVDPASEVALEVRRFLPPGANPEQPTTQRVVRVFTTIGRIEWQDDESSSPVPVVEGQVRVLLENTAETLVAGSSPAWILRDDLRDLDRGASNMLQSYLVPERPITLSLKERVQDRRTEIRSLAAVCLAYLGHYDALLLELDDSRQRAHWSAEFEALRNAVARSPEEAARVRETLHALQPAVGNDAFRLLSGYSPQQLNEGADETLVEFLEHDALILRILAFENLRRITNLTLLYRPYVSDELRRSSVRGWRERLENRSILYDSLPVVTSDRW